MKHCYNIYGREVQGASWTVGNFNVTESKFAEYETFTLRGLLHADLDKALIFVVDPDHWQPGPMSFLSGKAWCSFHCYMMMTTEQNVLLSGYLRENEIYPDILGIVAMYHTIKYDVTLSLEG